jgi:GNAT superfamily N-acetyltransferase
MKVRDATEVDVDAIVAMSSKFYATTNYRSYVNMDEETVANLVRMLIDTSIMLVAEDAGEVIGMAGMVIGPFLFNATIKGAHEVVWWVSPDSRGSGAGKELLKAIEQRAKDKGCRIIQMLTLSTSPVQAGQAYERIGYAHSETCYTKEI